MTLPFKKIFMNWRGLVALNCATTVTMISRLSIAYTDSLTPFVTTTTEVSAIVNGGRSYHTCATTFFH